MNRHSLTFYLFAEPSFFRGLGRVMDFGRTLDQYNTSESASEADYRAIASDWLAVGDDISEAIDLFADEELAGVRE